MNSIKNPNFYRKEDIKLGNMVAAESDWFGPSQMRNLNGELIKITGLGEIWGTVTAIYKHHCSVYCQEIRFYKLNDEEELIYETIPIKKEYQFTTSINFFHGEPNHTSKKLTIDTFEFI